jgi:hypothetical protein
VLRELKLMFEAEVSDAIILLILKLLRPINSFMSITYILFRLSEIAANF